MDSLQYLTFGRFYNMSISRQTVLHIAFDNMCIFLFNSQGPSKNCT